MSDLREASEKAARRLARYADSITGTDERRDYLRDLGTLKAALNSGTDQPGGEAEDFRGTLEKIGAVGTQSSISKHRASNHAHLVEVLSGLREKNETVAADTLTWLVWWSEFYSSRFYELVEALSPAPVKAEPEGWSDETVERAERARRDYLEYRDFANMHPEDKARALAAMRAALIAASPAAGDG